jgi:hypothetical protein
MKKLKKERSEIKLWGQPLTRDSSSMQGQAFEVSISRTYLVLLAEFGGKGDR